MDIKSKTQSQIKPKSTNPTQIKIGTISSEGEAINNSLSKGNKSFKSQVMSKPGNIFEKNEKEEVIYKSNTEKMKDFLESDEKIVNLNLDIEDNQYNKSIQTLYSRMKLSISKNDDKNEYENEVHDNQNPNVFINLNDDEVNFNTISYPNTCKSNYNQIEYNDDNLLPLNTQSNQVNINQHNQSYQPMPLNSKYEQPIYQYISYNNNQYTQEMNEGQDLKTSVNIQYTGENDFQYEDYFNNDYNHIPIQVNRIENDDDNVKEKKEYLVKENKRVKPMNISFNIHKKDDENCDLHEEDEDDFIIFDDEDNEKENQKVIFEKYYKINSQAQPIVLTKSESQSHIHDHVHPHTQAQGNSTTHINKRCNSMSILNQKSKKDEGNNEKERDFNIKISDYIKTDKKNKQEKVSSQVFINNQYKYPIKNPRMVNYNTKYQLKQRLKERYNFLISNTSEIQISSETVESLKIKHSENLKSFFIPKEGVRGGKVILGKAPFGMKMFVKKLNKNYSLSYSIQMKEYYCRLIQGSWRRWYYRRLQHIVKIQSYIRGYISRKKCNENTYMYFIYKKANEKLENIFKNHVFGNFLKNLIWKKEESSVKCMFLYKTHSRKEVFIRKSIKKTEKIVDTVNIMNINDAIIKTMSICYIDSLKEISSAIGEDKEKSVETRFKLTTINTNIRPTNGKGRLFRNKYSHKWYEDINENEVKGNYDNNVKKI